MEVGRAEIASPVTSLFASLRHPVESWSALQTRSKLWLIIVTLAFIAVTLMLYAVPGAATNYWFLYNMPLTMATFVFGLRGAVGGSIGAMISLTCLYFVSFSVRTELSAALEPLRDVSANPLASANVRLLVDQALSLAGDDPRAVAARGATGLLALIVTNVSLGILVDRGRRLEQMALERASDQLKRYFSPQLIQTIVTGERWVGLTTVRKEVTVLFTDLRGFTALTEQVEPEELGDILNAYLSEMTDVVFKYDGTLDKYIGDAVMAFFGDPIAHGDDPERAMRAAIEMRERFQKLRSRWTQEGHGSLNVGIGLNTGYVTAGNVGSRVRMEYTVIGSAVNVAARLADRASPGQILTTQRTLASLGHVVEWRTLGPVELDGVPYPVDAVEIVGLRLVPRDDPHTMADGGFDTVLAQAADDTAFRAVLLMRPEDALKPYRLNETQAIQVAQMASLLGYPIFRGVAGETVTRFVRVARSERFLAGTAIMDQKQGQGALRLVSEGEVSVHHIGIDGEASHVATVGRGSHFGGPIWLSSTDGRFTAYAFSDVELISIEDEDLEALFAMAPVLRDNITQEARRQNRALSVAVDAAV